LGVLISRRKKGGGKKKAKPHQGGKARKVPEVLIQTKREMASMEKKAAVQVGEGWGIVDHPSEERGSRKGSLSLVGGDQNL